MRKWIGALLALMLLMTCMPVTAEESTEAELIAAVQTAAAEKWSSLTEKDTGWVAEWEARTELVSASVDEKDRVTLVYRYPTVTSGVGARETAGEDVEGYMTRAMAGYLAMDAWETFEVVGSVTRGSVKFSGSKSPSNLRSAVKTAAGKAKSAFAKSGFTEAAGGLLIRHSVTLPSKKPADGLTLEPLDSDYAARFATSLGVSGEEAATRLTPFMLLLNVKKVDTSAGLTAAVMTVNAKSWSKLLEEAEALAMAQLDVTVGAPAMTREQLNALLAEQLPEALLTAAYGQKAKSTTMTVDLTLAVNGDYEAACPDLAQMIALYSAAWEETVDRLAASAATRDFYIAIDAPETGRLTGTDETEENGAVRLSFELGGDTTNNAWVRILKNGSDIGTGYLAQGSRLTFWVKPGDYTVVYGKGGQWYGETYLFADGGEYGTFDVTVPEMDRNTVYLYDSNGPLTVTAVDWHELTGAD